MGEKFECAVFVSERYPDDVGQWPGMYRGVTGATIARLLREHPGRAVVADRGYCIDASHPRFPDKIVPGPSGVSIRKEFMLVREVELS